MAGKFLVDVFEPRAIWRKIAHAFPPDKAISGGEGLARSSLLPQGETASMRQLTLLPKRVKARVERDRFSMRGLLMALLAFDAPSLDANHWAGRFGASVRSSKILGSNKTATKKTTTKTV